MDNRCKFLTIVKNENGAETWSCYNQFEQRGLIQSCFLPKGGCRYSNGPFPPSIQEINSEAAFNEKDGAAAK